MGFSKSLNSESSYYTQVDPNSFSTLHKSETTIFRGFITHLNYSLFVLIVGFEPTTSSVSAKHSNQTELYEYLEHLAGFKPAIS